MTTPAPAVQAVPGVEQLIEGLARIQAYALAGNVQAKRAAVLALAETGRRSAAASLTLSRALAEPGSHFGPEITEPLAAMSAHFGAAALAGGQSETALTILLTLSLAEAMAAGRQVPHYDELTETGAR